MGKSLPRMNAKGPLIFKTTYLGLNLKLESHSRASGNLVPPQLDSRLRGSDGV